jgi:uncharacterized protein YecE (DUF72 family)
MEAAAQRANKSRLDEADQATYP